MPRETIDLSGYLKAKKSSERRYEPVVPIDSYVDYSADSGLSWSPLGNVLNVDRLPQTDVIDVMLDEYDHTYRVPLISAGLAHLVDIKNIARDIESNVVALSIDKGEPFGTGLLVHPQLVLTARHCVEERNLERVVARINYQKVGDGTMDFGMRCPIIGIVEENQELDYAIIYLKNPIRNFSRVSYDFNPTSQGSSLFLHHPGGGAKKVSVHDTFESNNEVFSYEAFHDSQKGSSGGIYANANSKIFAMHCLNEEGVVSAKFLRDIHRNSRILQNLYNSKGMPTGTGVSFRPDRIRTERLPQNTMLSMFSSYLEVIQGRPDLYPRLNSGRDLRGRVINRDGKQELAYHHIITKENLEFLWMLGKDFPAIEELSKNLSWPDGSLDRNGKLIVNALIWAPWNLFIGPSPNYREKGNSPGCDPENGFESHLPPSFDSELGKLIGKLNTCIEDCWIKRQNISKLSREDTIRLLDQRRYKGTLGNPQVITPIAVTRHQEYRNILEEMALILQAIIDFPVISHIIHRTLDTDWTLSTSLSKLPERKYKLRLNPHVEKPADGLMDQRIESMEHLATHIDRRASSSHRERVTPRTYESSMARRR